MPKYFINSKIISCSRINAFKPNARSVVCIKHPISKPNKKENGNGKQKGISV